MNQSLFDRLRQIPEDRWFGLATLSFSGLLYSIHWQKTLEPTLGDPGPTLLPTIVAALMTLLGLLLLFKPTRSTEAADEPEGIWRPVRGAASVAAVLLYAWVLPNLGYAVSTALFFAATTWLLGRLTLKKAGMCVVTAVLVALATNYLLASVLNVSLPQGEWLYALKGVLLD